MNNSIYFTKNKSLKVWDRYVDIDPNCIEQMKQIAEMPFIHNHVALMPDAHLGKGCSIGSVIATKGAIIPASVGVDLNCGMLAAKLTLKASQLPDNLGQLRSLIESRIPHGRTADGGLGDKGSYSDEKYGHISNSLLYTSCGLFDRHPKALSKNIHRQLGTLGTGNHFIELCLDEHQDVWLMLHSGSRGFGASIGNYFIELAKKDMQKHFINLPNKDLSYLVEGTEHFQDYLTAILLASKYASANREIMFKTAIAAISDYTGLNVKYHDTIVDCHHNYISQEKHYGQEVLVTRKGAVSAKKDELGIIPGSMGAKSFIVKGLGNKESFCSCSHGAGRIMSRQEAKRKISLEEHSNNTQGVECKKDASVLDESPSAYKNIDDVMKSQEDLVEIIYTLKQIMCIKG